MDVRGASARADAVVRSTLGYIRPTAVRPVSYMFEPPAGMPRENTPVDLRVASITDARSRSIKPSLEREGFELRNAPSLAKDFGDDRQIRRIYYAECIDLAMRITGGRKAYVFDHLVRMREAGRPPLDMGRPGDGRRPSGNGRVHNDYSEASGRKRLTMVVPDASERQAVGRYCIVNFWRSIKAPVVDTPLAVCDATTVQAGDLVASEIRYQERTGEIYQCTYSPAHRWSYFSEMDRDEVLVFKQYDSQVSGTSRFTPHAAFDLPCIPPDAPLRESIEARCLVLF